MIDLESRIASTTVIDNDSNKNIAIKIRPKWPKLCSAKGMGRMASLYFCSDNCII